MQEDRAWARLTAAAARHGYRLEAVPTDHPLLQPDYIGRYDAATRTAVVRQDLDAFDRLATGLHEMAHALMDREAGRHEEWVAVAAGMHALSLVLEGSWGFWWAAYKRDLGRPAVRAAKRLARWCRG